MIAYRDGLFQLHTTHTSYIFKINALGVAEHLYYGGLIRIRDGEHLAQQRVFEPGNTILFDSRLPGFAMEDAMLEASTLGKGDLGEPLVEIVHGDGSSTCDFRYRSHCIDREAPRMKTLPGSYGNCDHLCLTLFDDSYGLTLELHYHVYEAEDMITRRAVLINTGAEEIQLERLLSSQLDLPTAGYVLTSFTGAWLREMERHDTPLTSGKAEVSSCAGVSSNRANPFTMLSTPATTEDWGQCYGFNLIYSGNHYSAFQVNAFGKTRMVTGINPRQFRFLLPPGVEFETPEALMSYSDKGFNGLSRNFHRFINDHIVRGCWKDRERPVLLNSWEACYFDINEEKLVALAGRCAQVGIELLVMDDGWFGHRNDDTSSLGDWTVNRQKLPGGLESLVSKVNALGVDFGIWVEPEMVSVDSHLYRSHPEWVMEIPGKPHSQGRNQRLLDLSQEAVQDYIISSLSAIFDSANIAYCKWDMNRIVSDAFSQALEPARQQELMHRYQTGLYRCMKILTEKYPRILFEGCASGGNRYDLGILCYFPQIWTSDNTDALHRSQIQNCVSYGYPQSTYTCHVSAVPSHQTLRVTPLDTRFNIAVFGCLGYEFDLCRLSAEELAEIARQVAWYKENRRIFQFGDFYRSRNDERILTWTVSSPDRQEAIGLIFQKFARANWYTECFQARGLLEDQLYRFTSVLGHEQEDCCSYGSGLMKAGVMLKQGYTYDWHHPELRRFPDFASRLYHIKSVQERE